MSIAYADYVKVIADNIAGCAGFLPAVRDTIDAANAILDDFDVTIQDANWFWQTVAADLFTRRPEEGADRADALTTAALEVLKELDSDGPVL
jgi:hypothetical protein